MTFMPRRCVLIGSVLCQLGEHGRIFGDKCLRRSVLPEFEKLCNDEETACLVDAATEPTPPHLASPQAHDGQVTNEDNPQTPLSSTLPVNSSAAGVCDDILHIVRWEADLEPTGFLSALLGNNLSVLEFQSMDATTVVCPPLITEDSPDEVLILHRCMDDGASHSASFLVADLLDSQRPDVGNNAAAAAAPCLSEATGGDNPTAPAAPTGPLPEHLTGAAASCMADDAVATNPQVQADEAAGGVSTPAAPEDAVSGAATDAQPAAPAVHPAPTAASVAAFIDSMTLPI